MKKLLCGLLLSVVFFSLTASYAYEPKHVDVSFSDSSVVIRISEDPFFPSAILCSGTIFALTASDKTLTSEFKNKLVLPKSFIYVVLNAPDPENDPIVDADYEMHCEFVRE